MSSSCACSCHYPTTAPSFLRCHCTCTSHDEYATRDYWITRLPDGGIHVASTRDTAVEPAAYYRDLCIPYTLIHEFASLRSAGDTASERYRELESDLMCTLNNASNMCEICRAQTDCDGVCASCFDQLTEHDTSSSADSHDLLGLVNRASMNYYAM